MTSSLTLPPQRSGRLGFSLLLALLALVAAAKVILADTLDPDCFWHIRVGEEIAHQGWPHPLLDDLSFASIPQPWTPYSWLAELGMKRLWDAGGFRAAVAAQAILESAFIILLGLCAVEFSASAHGRPRYLASALAAAMGGILSLAYLSFRPVTAALVGLSVVAWLLLRDRRKNQTSKAVWLVPPITAVLVNIHFYALFVPLWAAALLIGDVLQSSTTRPPRRLRGLLLLLSSLLACCLTPLLPGMIRSVLDYSRHDVMVRSETIAEFRPFYQGTMGHVSAALVGLLLIWTIWQFIRTRRVPLGEVIWLAGSTALLFRLGRMAPVFAIIAAPVFAAVLPELSDRILTRPPIVAIFAAALLLAAWPIARGFPGPARSLSSWLNRNGPDAPNYPCAAADFVEHNVPAKTHHLICELTWGGYLEWRLGPRFQTLMDGRTQLFSSEFWNTLALGSLPERRAYFAATPADAAVLRTSHNPFAQPLADLGWKTVYRDEFAEVLVPPSDK
ncbi:MAG: hypothetical protein ABSB74_16015 [Tepidisphaeraceae bacterium]